MRDYAVNAFESINAGVSRHLEKSVVSYVVSNLTLGNTIERLVSTWESLSTEGCFEYTVTVHGLSFKRTAALDVN